jgi:hypothetical protein
MKFFPCCNIFVLIQVKFGAENIKKTLLEGFVKHV